MSTAAEVKSQAQIANFDIAPAEIILRKSERGWVVIAENRSTGLLAFDEMLGAVAKLTLGLRLQFPMRTREEFAAIFRRSFEKSGEDGMDVDQYIAQELAKDFPQ